MDLIDITSRILTYGDISDHCLGRMAGKSSFGLTNDQRGAGLRITYYLSRNEPYQPHQGTCWICQEFLPRFLIVPLISIHLF